jgi:hypothetical protein
MFEVFSKNILEDDSDENLRIQSELLRSQWVERGLKTVAQQKNAMTQSRKAVKERFGEAHPVLEYLNFTTEEWIEVNRGTAATVAEQNEALIPLTPKTVNALVYRATNLLLSREWADIAAGLMLLTGRRSTEILKTARLEPKSSFSVIFRGALKRRGEPVELAFEVPSLTEATTVLTALDKLRKICPTESMSIEAVNGTLSGQIGAAVDRGFGDLLPPVKGRERVHAQMLRKLYAAIAVYFYCPLQVDEVEYRSHIQGHFSGHTDLSLAERRQIAADRHYRGYFIVDDDGAIRKGIRLDWQSVEVLEDFRSNQVVDGGISNQTLSNAKSALQDASSNSSGSSRSGDFKRLKVDVEMLRLCASLLEIPVLAEDGYQSLFDSVFAAVIEKLINSRAGEDLSPQAEPQAEPSGSSIAQLDELVKQMGGLVGKLRVQVEPDHEALDAMRQERDDACQKLEAMRQLLGVPAEAPRAVESVKAEPVEDKPVEDKPVEDKPVEDESVEAADTQQNTFNNGSDGAAQPALPSAAADIDPRLVRVIRSIIHHNEQAQSINDMWAINGLSVMTLARSIGAGTQSKVKAAVEVMSEEIEAHHQKHGLSKRHNKRHEKPIAESVKLIR